MARGKKKESALTPEEKLAQALVSDWEQPYKVPENWCWTRIGAISDFERGITFPASAKENEPNEENIPCLRTANVQENLEIDDLIYVNQSFMKGNEAKLVRESDIIMSSANSRELVGKSSFVTHVPFPMTFGGFVLNIRAKGIASKYLFYFLRHEFLAGRFMGESTQTTNIANINTTTLGGYELPLPPLEEQQRIVERIEYLFTKLDEAKEKALVVLDSFETRKAAILHKAFTGELTAKWRAEHGGQEWSIVTLGDVCRFENGYAFKSDKFSDVAGTPVVRISNISEMGVDVDGCILTTEVDIDKRFQVQYGDLLIAMSGATTGKNGVYLSDKIAFLNQRVGNIKIKNPSQLVPGYRNYYILHMRETILQNAYGGAQPNISSGKICSMEFPLSPFEEQQEIVRILDSLFAKEQQAKEAAEAVLEKIDLLKKSILARAFRGELGTNDPTEESAIELLKEVLQEDNTLAPRKRAESMPRELQTKLSSALERKIIKVYFQQETDSLPAGELLSIVTKKFEIMETLRNLEQRGIIKKLPNGNYRLLW